MKYITALVLSILLAFTVQVQGSAMIAQPNTQKQTVPSPASILEAQNLDQEVSDLIVEIAKKNNNVNDLHSTFVQKVCLLKMKIRKADIPAEEKESMIQILDLVDEMRNKGKEIDLTKIEKRNRFRALLLALSFDRAFAARNLANRVPQTMEQAIIASECINGPLGGKIADLQFARDTVSRITPIIIKH